MRRRESSDHPEALALYQEARERAITLDGTYALACAALADCYSILLDYGVIPPRSGLTAARLAAGRALAHAPDLAESLASAALVRQMDLDWAGAQEEFQKAIKAHPEYTVARQRYALFLACMGRGDDAQQEMDAALLHDPSSPAVAATAAWVPYLLGQSRRAEALAREAVLRHPGFTSAKVVLALSLVASGQYDAGCLALLAYCRARNGEVVEAKRHLRHLETWGSERYVSPYYLAVPQVGLEKDEAALASLNMARAEGAPQLIYLARDPVFHRLRGNSRFTSLLKQLGLPLPPMSSWEVPPPESRREAV